MRKNTFAAMVLYAMSDLLPPYLAAQTVPGDNWSDNNSYQSQPTPAKIVTGWPSSCRVATPGGLAALRQFFPAIRRMVCLILFRQYSV